MALERLDDRSAVLAAVDEFDRLGRAAFLQKYGFKEARDYFLQIGGKLYDSKAIAGVAYGNQYPAHGPLKAADFSGGAATVRRRLETLGFEFARSIDAPSDVEDRRDTRVSEFLTIGDVYTRDALKRILNTNDATINTGVFRPRGAQSVLLFVTESKTADRVQYVDRLDGDLLHWQGQSSGRTDSLVIEHRSRGLELLVFYRTKKYEHSGAAFKYEGPFDYVTHKESSPPTSFLLARNIEASDGLDVAAQAEAEAEAHVEASGVFDPSDLEDARKKTFSAIVMRQGQPAFRNALLNAYEGRCALTHCDIGEVLEAAHITRYLGPETNDVRNGLLLRADLHTLYDRSLIAIDPMTHKVSIASHLKGSEYSGLEGRALRLPANPLHRPSIHALLTHWMLVQSVWDGES
ncbi:HNH endonuclease signature motif containing protein [Caballeronia sp. LZ065]|uniref:HNH endonuclease n=1 Tax=Caballeronia sp. LZ065 TaxID=3038571 RepID=UPI0028567D13|nr:HNH endonuclease signature motif containing protein [Caballeronia sp. LZ065]MDR5779656.1 HNH endonuclease signature motif containing protein [Caballeronia sp. LZ065]